MQPVQHIYQTVNSLFEPIVGQIRVKTYFSYYGIFADEIMLALYKDNFIFLRATDTTRTAIQQVKGTFVLNDPKAGVCTKNFYAIPLDFAIQSTDFTLWVKTVFEELSIHRQQEDEKYKTQIRSLINLNFKIECLLKKINVKNVEEFKQKGYMSMFIELVKIDENISDLLLFKLYGATYKTFVYQLTTKTKIALLQEANQALAEAGLRHQFHIPE